MKSVFAIRQEDALSWHDAEQPVAALAQRCGHQVRALDRRWQVWATDGDFADLKVQACPAAD